MLLLVLVPVLYSVSFITDYSRERITARFGTNAAERLMIHAETARAIIETRGLGVGAGTFQQAFPVFRTKTPDFVGIWNAAHGSYIEWPFTYGVPWFLVLTGTLTAVMGTIFSARSKTGAANAALPGLVFTACLLHAAYDFGLQMLGLMIIVAALAGSSWGRAINSALKPSRRQPTARQAVTGAAR